MAWDILTGWVMATGWDIMAADTGDTIPPRLLLTMETHLTEDADRGAVR